MRQMIRYLSLWTAIFPFGLAFVLGMAVFVGGFGIVFGHDLATYGINLGWFGRVVGGVSAFLVIGFLQWFVRRWQSPEEKLSWHELLADAVLIVSAAVLIRCALAVLLSQELHQVNDNQLAWARAVGESVSADYLLWVPRWMNYIVFLRGYASFAGSGQISAAMQGVVLSSASVAAVYLMALKLCECRVAAVFSALAFAFFPAGIAYAVVCTPEHMAMGCFSVGMVVVISAIEAQYPKKFVLYCVAGVVFGVGDAVKPLAVLFAIAAGIVLLCQCQRRNWKEVVRGVVTVSAFVTLIRCTSAGVTRIAEREYGISLQDKNSSSHMLIVGLNRRGEGQIHIGDISRVVIHGVEAGLSVEEASRRGWRIVWNDWRGHWHEIPSFLVRKAIWVWQDMLIPFRFLDHMTAHEDRPPIRFSDSWTVGFSHGMYCWILFSCMVSCWRCSFHGRPIHLFVLLVVAGYFAVSMLIEGQSRYKVLILPVLFAWASSAWSRRRNGRLLSESGGCIEMSDLGWCK